MDKLDTESDIPIIARLGIATGLTICYVIVELKNKDNKKGI